MKTFFRSKATIADETEIERIIRRMAVQVVERDGGTERLMLVGIRTRGVPLAQRLAAAIQAMEGEEIPQGVLDITLYRDDLSAIGPQPVVKETRLPGPLSGRVVVLCDDVLFSGRTVRAALDALLDYGRPEAVRLAVLVDRGHRELPVQADVVGKEVPTAAHEHVEVHFQEIDGADRIRILERLPESESATGDESAGRPQKEER
ncbi:MAG: bifunctional pyr operon transcriptional regulator/uracil phosphoribosyltransferase PyrR [Acidobacteriota bacterium]